MYIKIKNGSIEKYPYSIDELKRDNPGTSFPDSLTDQTLSEFGIFPVIQIARPVVDNITKNVTESTPVLEETNWTQVWNVTDASSEEIEQRTLQYNEVQKQNRSIAYQQEADPLFFKWQAAEGTKEEWEVKRQEIRDRFPYI